MPSFSSTRSLIPSPLLDGRDALLLFYTLLDPLDGVGRLDVNLDLLACQGLDLDLQ